MLLQILSWVITGPSSQNAPLGWTCLAHHLRVPVAVGAEACVISEQVSEPTADPADYPANEPTDRAGRRGVAHRAHPRRSLRVRSALAVTAAGLWIADMKPPTRSAAIGPGLGSAINGSP